MQMFRSKISASLSKSQSVEEDYGDDANGGISSSSRAQGRSGKSGTEWNWQVHQTPSNELDHLMWGSAGLPAACPRFNKQWATKRVDGGGAGSPYGRSARACSSDDVAAVAASADDEDGVIEGSNDNILSALEHPLTAAALLPDEILLEDVVWKQRGGFGKYAFNLIQHEWEQRRLVLFKSGKLRYYDLQQQKLTTDPSSPDSDPNHDSNAVIGVVDCCQDPRGEMDLRPGSYSNFSNSVDHHNQHQDGGNNFLNRMGSLIQQNNSYDLMPDDVKVQARRRSEDPGMTPFEIDITRRDTTWRFCFASQSIQIQWLEMLKNIAADPYTDEEREALIGVDGEGLGADHGFQPGDHIIRWEMLPIMYPIQIHGIVLEAGSNLVIIADFGLASYDSHSGANKDLNTWSNESDVNSNDLILQAWEKIKPKEKKRLNVIAVTDPKEIRKWSKIRYGDQVEKTQKKSFFSKLLTGTKSDKDNVSKTAVDNETEVDEESVMRQDDYDVEDCDRPFEPEWMRRSPRSSRKAKPKDGQSVFSIDQLEGQKSELPKSDSAKLVLARTHFILENEHLLPPYHVFYSNSECIAVWAKTGRWSTLQAAVYLVSSSVGFGKSATMLTLSVAAAHMILVPALAVGGLAVVSAPLLFLRKSQEKWEEATMVLTDKFWMQAEPEVFVEAIEYWGARNGK